MAERNRTAALLAQMAATTALIDGLIAKAKGGAPRAPAKPEPQAPPANGSRTYIVEDWMPSCSKCGRNGRCGELPRECGKATWFPTHHVVTLEIANGVIARSSCREGRKPGGAPCRKADCKHIKRALDRFAGLPSRGVELSGLWGKPEVAPRCPSCRERWGVTARADGRFECRSPVCERDGRPWVFAEGDTAKPPPMRHGLVIKDRDPGRLVLKRES